MRGDNARDSMVRESEERLLDSQLMNAEESMRFSTLQQVYLSDVFR